MNNKERSSPIVSSSTTFATSSFRGASTDANDQQQQQQQQQQQLCFDPLSNEVVHQASGGGQTRAAAATANPGPIPPGGFPIVNFIQESFSSPLPVILTPPAPVTATTASLQQGSPHPVRPLALSRNDADPQAQHHSSMDSLVSPSSPSYQRQGSHNAAQHHSTSTLQSPSSAVSRGGRPPLPPSYSSLSPSMPFVTDSPAAPSSTAPILSGLSIPPPVTHYPGSGTKSLSNITTTAFPQTPSGAIDDIVHFSGATGSSFEAATSLPYQALSSPSSLSNFDVNSSANNNFSTAAEVDRRKKAAAESVQKLMAQFDMFSGPGSSNPNIHGLPTTAATTNHGASPLAPVDSAAPTTTTIANHSGGGSMSSTPPGAAAKLHIKIFSSSSSTISMMTPWVSIPWWAACQALPALPSTLFLLHQTHFPASGRTASLWVGDRQR
jgi:hypothetical protein